MFNGATVSPTLWFYLLVQALIPLANEGTDAGKVIASHALAKIAVTQNPEIAFPGQRVCGIVVI